jgi:hypothetical protein
MKAFSFFVLAISAAIASAQEIIPKAVPQLPTPGTKWVEGDKGTIEWTYENVSSCPSRVISLLL